jgi:thioredoxin-dependent peroxiredoxin
MAKGKSKKARGNAKSKPAKASTPAKAVKAVSKPAKVTKATSKPVKAAPKLAKASKVVAKASKAVKKSIKASKVVAKAAKTPAKPAPAKTAKAAAKPAKPMAKVASAVTKLAQAVTEPVRAAVKAALAPKPKVDKAAAPASGPTLDVGSSAPAFSLKDQSGATLSSAELSGKPYVLYFYPKDDTSGCTAEACGFRDSGPKFGERGVRVIGVSPDSEASHAKFAGKYGLPFTLLSDPEKSLIQAYGAWVEKQNYGRKYMGVQRSTFLVGSDGKIQKAWRSVRVPGHVDAVLSATAS